MYKASIAIESDANGKVIVVTTVTTTQKIGNPDQTILAAKTLAEQILSLIAKAK